MKCKSNSKLNKSSFLELLGNKINKNTPYYTIEAQEKQKILEKYYEFNSDLKATASYFGTTPERILRKINKEISNQSYVEYTSKSREYLEKNKNWKIKSFNSFSKEVCVSMEKTNVVMNFNLSNVKYS